MAANEATEGGNLYLFSSGYYQAGQPGLRSGVAEARPLAGENRDKKTMRRKCSRQASKDIGVNYNLAVQQESAGVREMLRDEFSVVANELTLRSGS